jgi:hypothetical protein
MDLEFWIDVFGWIGSAEVVIAYAMNSYQRMRSDSPVYQWLNLSGSIFLMINTAWYGAYPSAMVNVVWLFIAMSSRIKIKLKAYKS